MFRAGVQRSTAVDIWAFGVLCVELLTGREDPWFAQDYPQLMAAVLMTRSFQRFQMICRGSWVPIWLAALSTIRLTDRTLRRLCSS